MLRCRWLSSIIARLLSTEAGRFFFQPLQFHFQPPNVLVQRHFPFLMLALMALPTSAEKRAPGLQQLALPLADLIGRDTVLAGQFVDRLQTLHCFQSELELE